MQTNHFLQVYERTVIFHVDTFYSHFKTRLKRFLNIFKKITKSSKYIKKQRYIHVSTKTQR